MTKVRQRIGMILPTAGRGVRMGANRNKLFLEIAGKPILQHTLEVLLSHADITDLCLVTNLSEQDSIAQTVQQALLNCRPKNSSELNIYYAAGGESRRASVHNGLQKLAEAGFSDEDIVMVHDGARCFLEHGIIDRCILGAKKYGACIAAVPVKDTIKVVSADSVVQSTPERSALWQVQTPQSFKFELLLRASNEGPEEATDDASLVEALGHPVHIVKGSDFNIKITTPEDLVIGTAIARHLANQHIATER